MKQHPLSAFWPSMPEEDLAALAADIKANGLRTPGIIFEGKILDGWHRYQACEMAGVPFKSFPLPAGKEPAAFAISANAHRRNVTASQKAGAVASSVQWRERGGKQSAPGALRPPTDADLAKAAGVSERTVEQAKTTIRAGLGEELKEGKVSAKRGAEIARLPPDKRKAAVAAPSPTPKAGKPAALAAENERLREENESLRENLPELTAIASAADALKNDESFKKIVSLETELAQVKRSRDDFMRQCAELKKQIAYWKKQAGRKAA